MALYVASSVYISQGQEEPISPANIANLQFLISAMEAIGKAHSITRSFLRQLVLDLERVGLDSVVRVPRPEPDDDPVFSGGCGNNIPLFARSRYSKRSGIMPPLPGRLPLNKPFGGKPPPTTTNPVTTTTTTTDTAASFNTAGLTAPGLDQWDGGTYVQQDPAGATSNKRKRVALSPSPAPQSSSGVGTAEPETFGAMTWSFPGLVEEIISSSESSSDRNDKNSPSDASGGTYNHASASSSSPNSDFAVNQIRLPHRGPAGLSPLSAATSGSMNNDTMNNSTGSTPPNTSSYTSSSLTSKIPNHLATASGDNSDSTSEAMRDAVNVAMMDLLGQGGSSLNAWHGHANNWQAEGAFSSQQVQQHQQQQHSSQDPSRPLNARPLQQGLTEDDNWFMLGGAAMVGDARRSS